MHKYATSKKTYEISHMLDWRAVIQILNVLVYFQIPEGKKFFEGECIPEWDSIEKMFQDMNDEVYPHAWRGAVLCFILGLGLMVITDIFALMVRDWS